MAVSTKRLEFSIGIDRGGQLSAPDAGSLDTPDSWTPEHLLLAALARCSIASLSYHAARAHLDMSVRAETRGVVARRKLDGRFAFVQIEVQVALESDREVPSDELETLLAKAERDCFVGASFTAMPRYAWSLNGVPVSHAAGGRGA